MTVRAVVTSGGRAITPSIAWGPAVGDIAEISRYTQAAEGLLFQKGGKIQRLAAKDVAKQPTYEGDFFYGGVDDNYFMTVALSPGASKIAYQPVTIPPPAGSKDPGRQLVSYSIEPKTGGEAVKFFAGPKDFDVLTAIGPNVAEAINFGFFRVIVVPLLNSLKWINGYVGELRLGDHHPDGHHQHHHLPAPPQERGVDAEDAGDSARGEGDSGSLREAEGDRPREAEDEPGADGALQGARREPGERLRARCC